MHYSISKKDRDLVTNAISAISASLRELCMCYKQHGDMLKKDTSSQLDDYNSNIYLQYTKMAQQIKKAQRIIKILETLNTMNMIAEHDIIFMRLNATQYCQHIKGIVSRLKRRPHLRKDYATSCSIMNITIMRLRPQIQPNILLYLKGMLKMEKPSPAPSVI